MDSYRPHVYKQWDDISMVKAVDAVETKTLSLRRAAEVYNVPRATLHDRITGRVCHGSSSGPMRYLTVSEEEELVSFLVRCAKIGYPRSRKQVLAIAQQTLRAKGIDKELSSGWWDRFRQRHRNITLRSSAPLSHVRAMATDPETLDRYYDVLETTLKDNDLLGVPSQIFNCDETGLPLQPKAPKVIEEVGVRNPCHITSNTKSQVTVLGCVNAAGFALPPYVIFDRKTLNPELTKGEVPGTRYGLSPTGWMDTDLFLNWFMDHFLSYAPRSRPLLLIMDGHSSHFSPEMIRFAAKEKVILFTLPPHTTHLCQPLDKGCFASLKVNWRHVCHEYMTNNPGKVVTRYDFLPFFVMLGAEV